MYIIIYIYTLFPVPVTWWDSLSCELLMDPPNFNDVYNETAISNVYRVYKYRLQKVL